MDYESHQWLFYYFSISKFHYALFNALYCRSRPPFFFSFFYSYQISFIHIQYLNLVYCIIHLNEMYFNGWSSYWTIWSVQCQDLFLFIHVYIWKIQTEVFREQKNEGICTHQFVSPPNLPQSIESLSTEILYNRLPPNNGGPTVLL